MKPARGLRVALILARFEALLLIRNMLVLAGMLAGGALIIAGAFLATVGSGRAFR